MPTDYPGLGQRIRRLEKALKPRDRTVAVPDTYDNRQKYEGISDVEVVFLTEAEAKL